MKVVVMGTNHIGGLGTHYVKLLEFLVTEGHTAFAFAVTDDPTFAGVPGLHGIMRAQYIATTFRQRFTKYISLLRFARYIRTFQPDLFIATAPGHGYAKITRGARAGGTFTIWQAVTIPPFMDPLSSEMCRAADSVAVQTPGMLEPFRRAIPGVSKTSCLPCFFEPPATQKIAALPRKGEAVKLAYFGRLAGNKGLIPFLHVFHQASREHSLRLDIHGDGNERVALEETIAELDLSDRVQLIGHYPAGTAYGSLLRSYHALVLPSTKTEGLPLVLLEAMSCGLPFMATNIGGIGDVAVNNPDVVVVKPEPQALLIGLIRLLGLLQTRQISNQRLQNYYQQYFSVDSVVEVWRRMLVDPQAFFQG